MIFLHIIATVTAVVFVITVAAAPGPLQIRPPSRNTVTTATSG
eukprot:CAMPEP_0197528592 /NCGR_PEP_ID=MMETSP1318-20131121/25671_1 /TAXON_ID=552666 /ORGANISM="Partenskyella glossopodia, Strain RCC365" /LENGTH=42 /DNA_ID= /DNA_START= /DNA_END= /DNA_ORIENTATION=